MNNKKIVCYSYQLVSVFFWHFSLKLKTIHKMFLSVPIKGKSQWQDAGKVGHTCSEGNITQTTCTNIIRVVVLALSLHIIWHDFLFIFQRSTTWFRFLYMTFYLRCKGSTFLCSHTHHNAVMYSI